MRVSLIDSNNNFRFYELDVTVNLVGKKPSLNAANSYEEKRLNGKTQFINKVKWPNIST